MHHSKSGVSWYPSFSTIIRQTIVNWTVISCKSNEWIDYYKLNFSEQNYCKLVKISSNLYLSVTTYSTSFLSINLPPWQKVPKPFHISSLVWKTSFCDIPNYIKSWVTTEAVNFLVCWLYCFECFSAKYYLSQYIQYIHTVLNVFLLHIIFPNTYSTLSPIKILLLQTLFFFEEKLDQNHPPY